MLVYRFLLAIFLLLLIATPVQLQDLDDDEDPSTMDDADLGEDKPTEPMDDDTEDDTTEPETEPVAAKAVKTDYKSPTNPRTSHFFEAFDSKAEFSRRWIKSKAKKDGADSSIAKYDGVWEMEEPSDSQLIGDMSLVLKSKAHHHAISAALNKPFEFKDKPFVVQYEVRFKNGMECGGAYVKLLTKEGAKNLDEFHDKSPYTIMFGPDKCGLDNKLHFIFRHKNPVSGEVEEKHAKKNNEGIESFFTDKNTHVYRLVVKPDNTFVITVDETVKNQGSLLTDMDPPVNPPEEIDDPSDSKPKDWDDRKKIKDPDAVKPDDWDEDAPEKIEDADAVKPDGWLDDEPELIPDPAAEKPEDWDTEMDGEWEAAKISNPKCADAPGCGEWTRPMKKNPEYKGKWTAPMIDNPEYQGIWAPKRIRNPAYFKDDAPFKMSAIHALGLELWSMTEEIVFDNFLITDSIDVADTWLKETFHIKSKQEKATAAAASQSVVGAILDATNERPWLWAVIIVVFVLPIVLIVAYCCFSGSKSNDQIGVIKKTDAPTSDDQPEEDDEPEDPADTSEDKLEPEAGGDSVHQSRGDLDAPTEDISQKSGDEASDKEAILEDNGHEPVSDSPGRTSPRKRKTRKE